MLYLNGFNGNVPYIFTKYRFYVGKPTGVHCTKNEVVH